MGPPFRPISGPISENHLGPEMDLNSSKPDPLRIRPNSFKLAVGNHDISIADVMHNGDFSN